MKLTALIRPATAKLAVALLAFTCLTPAKADTATWTGATDSDWHTASNWSTGAVPDASVDVSIPENTSVIIGANTTATSGKLTVNGTLDIKGTLESSNATPTFNGKSNVTIEEGASWIVPSGGVIVHGNLTVNGTIRDTSSNVGKIYSNLGTAVITAASADACKLGSATNWRGTYVINWSPAGEFNLNNYGKHKDNVVVLGADLGSGGYFTENQTILPAIRLDSDVTIKNGSGRVEAQKTENLVTFTKLTGKHKLTTFATGNYNAWIWYKILTLDQFEGSLCLSRNTKVEIDVVNVAAEPANGTCVIPATVGKDAAIYGNLKLYVNNVDTGKVLTLGSDGLYAPIELAITPVDNASVSLATVNGDEVDASSGTITVKVGDQVVVTYTANEGYEVSNGTVNMTVAGGTTSVDTSTVSVKPYIAQIGSTNYVSLVTALGEATAGQTVTLLANNTEAAITIPANVTVATAGYSISGTIAGGGNINATADFTPTFGEWTGTFAICWNPDSSTTHLVLNKYGNADSKVEIKGVNGAFIALPSTGKAAPMVDPEIVLTANWTVNDGWDNTTTTFKKLSGAGILTINGSGLGTTAIPYTVEVLNGFTGTLAGVRGKYTIGDIVTANDGYGTCLVKYVANYDPVLTNTKVNGTAATLCVDTVNNQKGIYRVAATVNDVPYATLAGAIAAAETANVSEITILDGTSVSPDQDWKIVDGKLVKKVYVAQIGTTNYETLQAALNAVQDGETITVLQDITQDAGFLFDRTGVSAKLDLSNKTLMVNNGSNINNRAIKINNGTLEVCGGTVVAVGAGTNSSNGTGCYGAFRVEANGVLNAHDLALSNARPWGLNVKVLGGEATLTRVTINSSYGGGIEVTEANLGTNSKSGSATLTDCTFTQTGYFDHCSSCLSVSGGSALTINSGTYTSDNYALYVFSSGGTINVNGGTFSGNKNGVAIIAAIDTATYPQYVGGLNITGGKFTGGYSITSPAYMAVSGGIYAVDPSAYAATGYVIVANTDSETSAAYPYAVATAVASIGTTNYETLQAALNAVQDGDTITLLQDIEVEDSIDIALQGMAILDLNGKTISAAGGSVDDQVFTANSAHDYLIGVKYGATLMIVDSQGGGSVDGRDLLVAVKLTTKGEVYDGETTADLVVGAEDEDNAFTIVGGTYGVSGNGMRHGTGLEVYGGTIIGTAGTGIYNPQDGSLLIQAGTIQGRDSAVEVRAGQASFWGGTYVVTGTDAYSSVSNGNGTTTKGAAIAIVPHTTGKEVVVKVLDGNEAEGENFTFTLPEGAVRFAIANTENSDFSAVDITVADLGYIFGESFALPSGYNWYYANDLELFTLKQTVAELLNGDTHVAYYSTLADAISDATDGQTIKLLANIGLTNRLFINAGATPAYAGTDNRYATTSENKALTIDMNGHNITSESNIALAGGSLAITGTGTITTTASGLAPVEVRGTGSLASKRTLTIGEGVTLDGPSYGLNVFGSNDAQKNKIDVTVGGTVNGTLFVLGNLTNAENEINIVVNGTVQVGPASANAAPNVGIALNGNANVTVNEGASVSGESGIEVRAGNLTVNGGTITATAQTYSYTANGSGSTTRGAAISVAQHTTVLPTAVTLNGGTLEGVEKVYVKEVNTGMPNVTVQATENYVASATLPADYKWAETETTGVYEIVPKDYVAQIGETKYESLAEAVAAANASAATTITLLTDVTLTETIEINRPLATISTKALTIDLNNHNITATDCRALWAKIGYVIIGGTGTISSAKTPGSAFSVDSSVVRVGWVTESPASNKTAILELGSDATVSTDYCYGVTVFGNNKALMTSLAGQTFRCSGTVAATGTVPAVSGNGTSTLTRADITINEGATVSATSDYAIYFPQRGWLTVNGTVIGQGGIEMKAGKLVTSETTVITATGTPSHPGVNNNGASTSGYAVAFVENDGYYGYKSLGTSIAAGTFNGAVALLRDNALDSTKENSIVISGGNFGSIAKDDGAISTIAVSGGTFDTAVPANCCADHYEPTGADETTGKYTVQFKVSDAAASITKNDKTAYYLTINDAITAATAGDTVKLEQDSTSSNYIYISKAITFDLNGHDITSSNATAGVVIGAAGITLTDSSENPGAITTTATAASAVYLNSNCSVTIDTITVSSQNIGVKNNRGTVTVNGGTIAGKNGIAIYGNGTAGSATLTVNGGTITGTNLAITGNGTANEGGTVITINGGSISVADDVAIYQPQSGTLMVTGGTITGATAIYQKCGTLDITGGTITGTGVAAEYVHNGSGANATGDAIVIDNCAFPGGAPSAQIKDATIASDNGRQIGYFVYEDSAEGTVLAGSRYTLNTNDERTWLADSSVAGYGYKIGETVYMAQIGNVKYETLAAAVDAVAANGKETTIKLLMDTTGSGVIVAAGKNIVFDLDGHTYTVVAPTVGSSGTETNAFQLLAGSTVTFKNGRLESAVAKIFLQNYSNLTLDGVVINKNKNTQMQYAVSNNNGSMTATGATEIYGSAGQVAFDICANTFYPDGVSVKFDAGFTGKVEGTIEYGVWGGVPATNKATLGIAAGTFDIAWRVDERLENDAKTNLNVAGGSFNIAVPSDYCAVGCVRTEVPDADGRYTVTIQGTYEVEVPAENVVKTETQAEAEAIAEAASTEAIKLPAEVAAELKTVEEVADYKKAFKYEVTEVKDQGVTTGYTVTPVLNPEAAVTLTGDTEATPVKAVSTGADMEGEAKIEIKTIPGLYYSVSVSDTVDGDYTPVDESADATMATAKTMKLDVDDIVPEEAGSTKYIKVTTTATSSQTGTQVKSTTTVGVMKTDTPKKLEIVPVPWKGVGEETATVKVSDIIKTSTLDEGAKIHVADGENGYNTWKLQGGKWVALNTTVATQPGQEAEPEAGVDASTISVPQGGAFWVEQETPKPIVMIGEVGETPTKKEVPANTSGLCASPKGVEFNLSTITTAETSDTITVLDEDGKPTNLSYRDGGWKVLRFNTTTRKNEWATPDADLLKIKAGAGFWFNNHSGTKLSINW